MIKAIIRGCRIDNCVRLWSRHATPKAFTHLIVSGPTGRAVLNHLVESATGLFVFGHPTLGDWAAVPAQFKRPDGGVLHSFAGVTPDDGGEPLTAAEFAARDAVELYVLGHVERLANSTRRDGQPFAGLGLTSATLLDAITPSAVVWRSDGAATWASVDAQYKRANGTPRVDPDDVQATTELRWVDPL